MTKLAPVYDINLNDNVTAEIQAAAQEAARKDELKFREALDQLVEIFTSDTIESSIRIERMLTVGSQYLSMSSGVLGSVMGNSLEVICAVGEMAKQVKVDDKIILKDTLCAFVLDSDEPIAVHDLASSQLAGVAPVNAPQAYLGTQVLTDNGPLGTVSFFSAESRDTPFSDFEKRILNIIANWSGTIIGNLEQLEFLSLQNDYYSSLFQTVPSMMMLCNADGLILSTSDRLSTTIGTDPLKLPGQNCQIYFLEKEKSDLTEALITGDIQRLPLTLCLSDGEKLDVELNCCIKSIGSMQGVRMIVLVDVSERNRAIKAVEEQNVQLALVNKSLNQFAFIASHDLQEPLRKIQQFSQFLEEDLGDVITEDGKYHMNVIVNSAKRMSTLIQDLLKFSSAAKDELVVTDVDLSLLLTEVCSELELRIEETQAQVIISDLPIVKADRSLTRQLFTNLVGNSLKYRDAARAPIIRINALKTADSLAITIADNGIGFDQKLASKAFEPFSRLHTSKEYKGNGIGLSICYTVCEKHNWKLSASSQLGAGSEFKILMPSQE